MLLLSVFLAAALLSGCGAAPSTLALIPSTGQGMAFHIYEYALVEQSTDNPASSTFQARVPEAIASGGAAYGTPRPADALAAPNRLLVPAGYLLSLNPSPPFSAYALYHDGVLVQRDITRIDPAVQDASGTFTLTVETLTGERMVVSPNGVVPWQGDTNGGEKGPEAAAGTIDNAFIDEPLVYAGAGPLLEGPAGRAAEAPIEGVLLYQNTIGAETFTLYNQDGIVHVRYAGRDLSNVYDQVISGQSGATSSYNPGGNGSMVWFYALRDGLWYYVEAGLYRQ